MNAERDPDAVRGIAVGVIPLQKLEISAGLNQRQPAESKVAVMCCPFQADRAFL